MTTFQKNIKLIAEHSLIWHFRLPIKTLFAYQRNQIYSEASSTHFSAINLSYFTIYPLNSSWIYIKYPTFQKTIRVIVEHNSIWHYLIYQSKHFSPPNAIKYILKHLQHTFQLLIYHTLTLYPSYSLLIQINHRHFSTLLDLSRNTIQFDTLWLPIKTLLTSQRKQIYSEASSTHFSAINLSYTYALPIILLLIQINHKYFSTLSDLSRNTIQFNTLRFTNQKTSRLSTQSNIFWSIFNTLFSY